MDRKTKREVVATLIQQGRRDLAVRLVRADQGLYEVEKLTDQMFATLTKISRVLKRVSGEETVKDQVYWVEQSIRELMSELDIALSVLKQAAASPG